MLRQTGDRSSGVRGLSVGRFATRPLRPPVAGASVRFEEKELERADAPHGFERGGAAQRMHPCDGRTL